LDVDVAYQAVDTKMFSHNIFSQKTRFVSMSVTSGFLHVFSKVSAAIAKMDILENVHFLGFF
jgi:hypothetical protein